MEAKRRKRLRLTGKERWVDEIVSRETKESAQRGEVYARTTKTVTDSVRQVELECGHWEEARYCVGLKTVICCRFCDDESAALDAP